MIYDELIDKIRRLEEDRHNVDISWADWGTSTRTSKVRGPGRKKAGTFSTYYFTQQFSNIFYLTFTVTVSGPYIVYMLAEEDILEDWKIIRKALKRSGSTS